MLNTALNCTTRSPDTPANQLARAAKLYIKEMSPHMAKAEFTLHGNFDEILSAIEQEIVSGSISANLEDGTDWHLGH